MAPVDLLGDRGGILGDGCVQRFLVGLLHIDRGEDDRPGWLGDRAARSDKRANCHEEEGECGEDLLIGLLGTRVFVQGIHERDDRE